MKKLIITFLTLAVFVMPQGHVKTSQAQELTDAQKAQFEEMMKNYLLENGELILESVNKYQAELQEKDRAEAAIKAKAFMEEIAKQDLPYTGNEKGDVTLVEFFDYNCGYCRKALTEIQKVLEDDKNIKVVFMDMPILGPQSLEASKWSLAAHRQGKYFEYHQAIMDHNGPKDAKNLERLAKEMDLDVKKLKKDKDDPKIEETLENHVVKAQEMGIRGTPGFIIQDQVFPGYIPADKIKEIIAEARE